MGVCRLLFQYNTSLITFNHPIKYYDAETDSVQFIKNAFSQVKNGENLSYVNTGNSYNVSISEKISEGLDFSYGQYSLHMRPLTTFESEKVILADKELIYEKVFDNYTNICYTLDNSGIKESIIVSEPNGKSTYDFVFKSNNLVPQESRGSTITFIDKSTGESIYFIQPTFIIDSYDDEYVNGEEHITYNNYYEIETLAEDTFLVHMKLDENFLNSDSTVYPCIIDPSIWATFLNNNSSSYVTQSGGTGHIDGQLSAGYFNGTGEHLSYVKSNSVNKLRWIEPNRLQLASFNVKASSTGYSTDCTINLYDSTTSSDVSAVTYSELMSSLGTLQSSTVFTDLGVNYSFDVTSLFRQWISYEIGEGGKNPAYGFILKGATNLSTPGRWFSSTSSSDTYFYLVYQEGEELEDGFYNIKNVSTGTYLSFNNNNGQVELSSSPILDACKWQFILCKNDAGTLTYGCYMISPYNNLNVSLRGQTTGEYVSTNAIGNVFRVIRNADGTFRIMPTNSASVSNGIGITSNYIQIQEYSNISSMKWTFEPVVNRFFSEYKPEKYNHDSIKERLNCYAYAFGFIEAYYVSDDGKQQPGYFASDSDIGLMKPLINSNSSIFMDNMVYNMNLDASNLDYSITEYIPENGIIEQFGAYSRLIAVVVEEGSRYHFYMQHNDGTWSHKSGDYPVQNTAFSSTSSNMIYLNNGNIQQYITDRYYKNPVYKFFLITKDAVKDYPHGKSNSPYQNEFYSTDKAGDTMFTSSSLLLGNQEGVIDTYNDEDFFVFNPTITRNYTIQTSSYRRSSSNTISDINYDDIDCEIFDKNGNLIYTLNNSGQINTTISLIGGYNYFIKIYNYTQAECSYSITLS